jgi:hypothetical protein
VTAFDENFQKAMAAAAGETSTERKASLRRDRLTGRSWLMFLTRPGAETIAALKAAGWRWSGYRKEWNHPSRRPTIPVPYEDEGEVDYSEERAERLTERAGKHEAHAEAARHRGETISGGIPLGQPILVGHHSEKRHRRDIERIRGAIEKEMEYRGTAEELRTKAASSAAHQEHIQSAPVIARRLERQKADLRASERILEGLRAEGSVGTYEQRVIDLRSDVASTEAKLAEVGGVPEHDVRVGDVIRSRGQLFKVDRIGPKTVTATVMEGGAKGMQLKVDRTRIQEIVEKSSGPPPTKPKMPKSPHEALIKFVYAGSSPAYRDKTKEGKRSVMFSASMGGGLQTLEDASREVLVKIAGERMDFLRRIIKSSEEHIAEVRKMVPNAAMPLEQARLDDARKELAQGEAALAK